MRTNRGKRLYAFFAVALAVFVGLITLTGIVCDGFATAARIKQVRESETHQQDQAVIDQAKAMLAAAEEATSMALKDLEEIHSQFTAFLSTHLADLAAQDMVSTSSDSVQDTAASSTFEPARRMVPNPTWQKVNQQLEDLRRRRADLLANLTESHPLARQLELAVKDIENQLKKIPDQVEEQVEPTVASTEQQSDNRKQPAQIQEKSLLEWRKADSKFRELAGEVGTAEEAYKHSLGQEKNARQEMERLMAAAAAKPTVIQTAAGANPQLTIYLCGLIAIATGVLVARWAQITEATFQTAAEVRQALGVPVLGVLSRDPHVEPRDRPKSEKRWVRRAVLSAELFLAAAISMLAIAAIADRQFLFDLITDPLATCSERFWC